MRATAIQLASPLWSPHDEQSSRAWLYGKLFVALLSQRVAQVGRTLSPWGDLLPQTSDNQFVA
jgi:hypothetical protein